MNSVNYSLNFCIIAPELIVLFFALVSVLVGAFCPNHRARIYGLLAIAGFAAAGIDLYCPERLQHISSSGAPALAFGGMFIDDAFARFVKLILLIAGGMSLLLSWTYIEDEKLARPEYAMLTAFATLGMMLMVSAGDFMALYVGLELQSLSLYVLAALRRDDAKSSEAGLKYFVLGALSSGLILYGISLIYGFVGTTNFAQVLAALHGGTPVPLGVVFGLVFVCSALAFKVSAVPFHMWTPDVYEGAPTPVTAFFAAAPKAAALALFARVLLQPLAGIVFEWQQIIIFISVASMLLGSFAGLRQVNIKRLMAYSSIANVGFMLAGLAADSESGLQALLIYVSVYFVTLLGVFGVILCMRRQGKMLENLGDFAGLSRSHPLIAISMVFFMFSLAGVPPLAGFFGKYFVFLAAVKAHLVPLAVLGMLTSVVSAYYYLRLIKIMYFDEASQPIDPLPDTGVRLVLGVAAVYMLVFTVWPAPVIEGAAKAAKNFIGG